MAKLDEGEQRAVEIIKRHGWMVQMVSPCKEDDPDELFAYTVGLSVTFGWPEMICFGLDQDIMHRLLNNAVEECRDYKLEPTPGCILREVAAGSLVSLRHFPPSLHREYIGWATWFAQLSGVKSTDLSCLQLVWPDKLGRFPDDAECIQDVVDFQRPLALPN